MTVSPRALSVACRVVFALFRIDGDSILHIQAELDRWYSGAATDASEVVVDSSLDFRQLLALSLLKLFIERPLYASFGVFCILSSPVVFGYKLVF